MMIGKTIAGVDERDDVLVLRFTDGTGARVRAHAYDDASIDWAAMSSADLRRDAAEMQGRRERARLARLCREELDSLPAEERQRRYEARRAKMSPFALAMEDSMMAAARDQATLMNRLVATRVGKGRRA